MKISFTGTHGTGKTTSVYETAYKMKIMYPNKKISILTDTARKCPFSISNKNLIEKRQIWIFCNQLINETDLDSKCDILITDRTIIDSIAYTIVFGKHELANILLEIAKYYINSYDKIIFKTIENNDYLFKEGEERDVEDLEYRRKVQSELIRLYESLKIYNKFEFEIR